jgi:hypothetical protein
MNFYWILAFVVAPILALGFGVALVPINERSLKETPHAPGA